MYRDNRHVSGGLTGVVVPHQLEYIDFDRYAELLRLYDARFSLSIEDSEGRMVYPSEATGVKLLTRPFRDDAGVVIGSVTCRAQSPCELPAAVEQVFLYCVDTMESESARKEELDSMARELGERCDELNMLYLADDDAASQETSTQAFDSLLKGMVDYVDVQAAVLFFPAQQEAYVHGQGDVATRMSLTDVATFFWTLLKVDSEPVVINTAEERLSRAPFLRCKTIAVPVRFNNQALGVFCVFRSLSEGDFMNSDRNLASVIARKAAKVHMACHDMLTGALNRGAFMKTLDRSLRSLKDNRCFTEHAFLMVAIDSMRVINQIKGHEYGDAVMRYVARKLSDSGHQVGRLGGDTFGVLLEGQSLEEALDTAERIRDDIGSYQPLIRSEQIEVSVSIGVCGYEAGTSSHTEVVDRAEVAVNDAKERGRNRVRAYRVQDQHLQYLREEVMWMQRINEALAGDLFELFAQPIASCSDTSDIHHYEILLRMQDDDGKIISPVAFLPAAERFHLMPLIDEWVVRKTVEAVVSGWPRLSGTDINLAINLSGQGLEDEKFRRFLATTLESLPFPPARLGFEITETTFLRNLEEAQKFIDLIKSFGCEVYLDDFGTGVATFDYLKSLPIDAVKIDGSFVKDIMTNPVSATMVGAISKVAQVMGIFTVGEFVETVEIAERLSELEIDYAQGRGIGSPGPLDELLENLSGGGDSLAESA